MTKDKRKPKAAVPVCTTCSNLKSVQVLGEWIDCPVCVRRKRR